MILALEIAGIVVAVLLVAGTLLRIRKLKRDEMRELSKPLERRLVSPPPSPYAPSKGFRLLDGSGEPVTRPPVERPRLDPGRQHVFSDSASGEESSALHARHNDDWFLSRSSHRSTASFVARSVAVIDTGIKASMVRELLARGACVTLHPCTTTAAELLAEDPDAVFLANGPGDPAALDYVVDTVRKLVGHRPVWGICLGHQLLCRALGLQTFKLPFGHRGANHPVKDLQTGRVEITSQNHGFAVLGPSGSRTIDSSRPVRWHTDFGAAQLSHVNLYDRTVEGFELLDVAGGAVQYHPEAGPGPHDSLYLFDRFLERIAAA